MHQFGFDTIFDLILWQTSSKYVILYNNKIDFYTFLLNQLESSRFCSDDRWMKRTMANINQFIP